MLFVCHPIKTSVKIRKRCLAENWSSAWIVTCVGSLKQAHLRMAGATERTLFKGPFEITSLVGTLSQDGVPHAHP